MMIDAPEEAGLRLLIVESSERECQRLLATLRDRGHSLAYRHIPDLEKLTQALGERHWDLALLNCNLDHLAAETALAEIRRFDGAMPVILVVERGCRTLPVGLLESGAQDFIFKSNLARLAPLVDRECLNGRLMRRSEQAVQAVSEAARMMGDSEARFLQLAGNIPECFWLVDAATLQVTYISKAYEQIWGRYVEALYADVMDWRQFVHPDDRARVEAAMRKHRYGGLDEKFRVIRPDGAMRWLHARNFPIRNAAGEVASIGGLAADITSLVADSSQLARLAHFDVLTALPNQIAFYDRLQNLLALALRNGMGLAVLIIDIDRFRQVNETLGHQAGDELLRQVAGRLSGSLREGDTVGRLSADVFGAILTNTGDAQQAGIVARRMIEMLATPLRVDGRDLFSTASIGVALYPHDGKERHELVRSAESAMRRAKETGRNNIQFFAPRLHVEVRDRLFLEIDLRNAAARDEFLLVYQPKVSCANGHVTGAEALVRWQHPKRGLVGPDQFIPLLEDTGLIIPVGRWILQEACNQVMVWRKAGLRLPSVSVNLSARQLQSETICDDVRKALEVSGLPPACLDLEITESMLMQQSASAVRILDSLKALGVTISLDDFGTGYSSLAYLKRFPLDAVKVDRSFVQDITADSDDASITRAVITMAHHLKLKVVAEGVETEGQLALLISHQCDVIQGYFFSRPLAVAQMEELLAEDRHLPSNLLRSGTRKPMALFAGVHGFDDVVAQLERDGHRICIAKDEEAARQWFAGNLADVLICGVPRRDFDALSLLRQARALQPQCERLLLVDGRHWRTVGAVTSDGTVNRLMRLPLKSETLRSIVEESLLQRQISEDFGRLSEEVETAARELVRVEEERRRLEVANRSLQELGGNGYAILQSVMLQLPWPAFGVDGDGLLAMASETALQAFAERMPVIGTPFAEILPELDQAKGDLVEIGDKTYRVVRRTIEVEGKPIGDLLFLQEGNAS